MGLSEPEAALRRQTLFLSSHEPQSVTSFNFHLVSN
jgi:hypothetical protein